MALAERVPASDTDPRTEVGQVGSALNELLDHVGAALTARHESELRVRQFVADASHELRTPLASIRGYAELSRREREPVPPSVTHALGRVESEATRMAVLVDDLLLLARLDAGRPLDEEQVDITRIVVDAVSDAHAAGPDHIWQLDVPEESAYVRGDPARLHQVVANLLANARTHTPAGTTVNARVQHVDGEVTVSVDGQRPRHPGVVAAQRVCPLHPRRQLTLPGGGEHRTRPQHRAGRRPGPRRPGRPRQPAGGHVVPAGAALGLTAPSAAQAGERNAASDATYIAGSWAPQSSRAECMASCGAPTSTVVTPRPPAVIGPTVEPQGRSARCS